MKDFMIGYPFSFDGMKVYEEPLPPAKFTLSKKVQVSDKFRTNFDIWLLERFGTQKPILKNHFLVSERFGMVIVPHGRLGILDINTT